MMMGAHNFLGCLVREEKQKQKIMKNVLLPEHFGMSQTAIDVGVHRGSHIAPLCSWWTFMASIHEPIVTSSLLNILKLKYQDTCINLM